MAYVKKYATEEERRKAKSEAGKKGAASRIAKGNNKGGRPKGSTNKNPRTTIPPRTLTVREDDYLVFEKLSSVMGLPKVEFMHKIAESLKAKNPDHFKEEPKVEM